MIYRFGKPVDQRDRSFSMALKVCSIVLGLVGFAFASLGGESGSVQADALHTQGRLQSTAAQEYSLHEIDTPRGIVLREYVSPSGRVFAVTWHGPWMPDMHQLLGIYFGQYQQAAQQQLRAHPGRHPLVIETPGLMLTLAGHPGWFFGRAYIPDLVPHGVHAEELK